VKRVSRNGAATQRLEKMKTFLIRCAVAPLREKNPASIMLSGSFPGRMGEEGFTQRCGDATIGRNENPLNPLRRGVVA
jgi:hypothetical protein